MLALANGQASSFVVAGREQLPSNPGGWLTSPFVLAASVESLDTDHVVASTPASLPVAGPETSTVSLRRLTPAGFLMANFAESEATGCRSFPTGHCMDGSTFGPSSCTMVHARDMFAEPDRRQALMAIENC